MKTFTGHSGYIWSAAFSPDGKTLVSGSDDRTIKWWDAASAELIKTLEGHEGYVYSVSFHPDGRSIISGSADHTLRWWDLETGSVIRDFTGHQEIVWSVVFSPDGRYIISCSWDDTIKIWQPGTGECIATIPLLWRPREIKPSPVQPGFYACADGNGAIALFDFSDVMK
jgi:WD40 repeat protein